MGKSWIEIRNVTSARETWAFLLIKIRVVNLVYYTRIFKSSRIMIEEGGAEGVALRFRTPG
jgi:hypothetical protein